MAEFIKLGDRHISTDQIKAVGEEVDGSVLLHYVGGGCEPYTGDEAAMLLEWVGANQANTPKTDAAVAAREREAAHAAAAVAKAEKAAAKKEAKVHAKEAKEHAVEEHEEAPAPEPATPTT